MSMKLQAKAAREAIPPSHRGPLRRSEEICRMRGPALALAVFSLLVTSASARAGGLKPVVASTQRLAQLLSAHQVHRRPQARSELVTSVPAHTPITGERTTLPVLAQAIARNGIAWLRVMVPGRPNGSTGWIAKQGTRTAATGWRLLVNLTARVVKVYRHGRFLRSFRAVVGKPSTPTPTGRFFVQETLRMSPGEPGGPFALALSARSNALREFEGGPGQIALHGRGELGGTLGAAESHGCVRLATSSIDWLAARIGPGVPVTIVG
jgi:lipoprotein-anchoring transpeptidase ErfK/SrfK